MSAPQGAAKRYYVPQPSSWPITGACALLLTTSGAATWINRGVFGPYILLAGAALLAYTLFGWFGSVIRESEAGLYNDQVDHSYRWAMGWFIFSETMLFAAFFGALFYMRWHAVPDLASGETAQLWPGFKGTWPTSGPGIEGTFQPEHASGIPLINTILLLTSAATLLWAHWGLQKGARGQLKLGLLLTIGLGIVFLYLQLTEHYHAWTALHLQLGSGAYGAHCIKRLSAIHRPAFLAASRGGEQARRAWGAAALGSKDEMSQTSARETMPRALSFFAKRRPI